MIGEPTRILLVDNQVDAREWLAEWLRSRTAYNFDVQTADNGTQCIEKVNATAGKYDVIVMDLFLGDGQDGIETMVKVKKRFPGIETIIITGFGDGKDGIRAIDAGAFRYVLKPFRKEELAVYIHGAAERRKLVSEVSRAKIYETFTALRKGLDLSDILDRIVENLHGLFSLSTCTIMLLDPERTSLEMVAERGVGKKVTRPLSELPKDVTKVFVHDEPLEIPNLDERADWRKVLVRSDLKSFTILPLKDSKGEPAGVITMGRVHRTAQSSEEELRLLKGLADQAAIAIENARLHEELKQRAKLLETLEVASLDIAEPNEVHDVLRKTIQGATSLLEASGGAVYLFSSTSESEELEVKASFGDPLISEGTRVDKEKGVVGKVVATGEPFSQSRYNDWPDRQDQFDKLGLQAVVGVPITSGEHLLGVLAVHHNQVGKEFSREQQNILLSFGKHAGAALEKAQMLNEQKKAGELIEALVSEIDDDRLMEKIVDLVSDHFSNSYCEILLKEPNVNELRVAASNFPAHVDRTTPVKLSKARGITAWVGTTRTPKVIRDVRSEKIYVPVLSETRSEIAVPLVVGTKLIGVLNVESSRVATFTERDEKVLSQLATAIGVRVNQAQRIDEAKRKMEQSQTLTRFTSEVAAAPDIENKLRIVSKKLLDVSGADFSIVMLLTSDGHSLRVRAGHAVETRVTWNPGMGQVCSLLAIPHLAESVLSASHKTYKRGEPFGERLLQSLAEHASIKQKLRSVLVVPLKQGANFEGICVLGEMDGHAGEIFTGQRIGSAVTVAESAAPLIQQARSLELERKRREVLEKLTIVGSTVTATLVQEKVFNLIDQYCLELLNAEVSTTFVVRRPGFLSLVSNSGSPPGSARIGLELEIRDDDGLTGHIAAHGEIFNKYGQELHDHPAIKSNGPHPHLPTGYCHSLLAVPLKKVVEGQEEVIGLLKVENKKDHAGKIDTTSGFNNEDELVLRTLASFAETAIQNADYFAFTEALQRGSQVVNSSIDDYRGVLDRVLAELRQIIPFDTASIQLLTGNALKVEACLWFDDLEKQNVLKLTYPLIPRFPNEQVMRNRRPLLIDDVRATRYEHFWKEKIYCSTHIRSWLGVPLLSGNKAIGMLSIESNKPSFYTNTHVEQSLAFANQVVPAIENSQLYKSAECLIGLVEELAKNLESETVLQKIADDAIDKQAIIGADKAIIYEYDADRGTFSPEAVHAGDLKRPDLSNPPFSQASVIHRCTQLRTPHLAPIVSKCDVLRGRFTRREKIASAAVFPLIVDDQLVGLMFINYLTDHVFTPQEVRVMELFARHAAIAIYNARQYDILKKRMETATAMARVGRLASTWAHEVHTPTLAIRVDVDTLRSEAQDQQTSEILEEIYEAAQEIALVIPNNLPMSHETEKVDLKSIVNKICQKREEELARARISIESNLEGIPLVLMNYQWLEWIFDRMINNAVRFMPQGGTISFFAEIRNKRLFLDIIDTGPGLPDGLRNQLYTGKVIDPQSEGQGFSLLLIRSVLNDFNSDIEIPRKDHRGNVFTIDLPLALNSEVKTSDS